MPAAAWAGRDLRIDYGRSELAIRTGVGSHRYLVGSVGAANIWGWPGEETALLLRMPHLRWGALDLYQLGVAPLPPGPEPLRKGDPIGVIGDDLLKHSTLEIDYSESVAYFDRTSYTDDDELLTIGMTLQPTSSGRYFVRGVGAWQLWRVCGPRIDS